MTERPFHWRPARMLGRGIQLGFLTGALLGLATLVVLLVAGLLVSALRADPASAGTPSPNQVLPNLAALGVFSLFAMALGGILGAADALLTVLALLLASPFLVRDLRVARSLAGASAAAPWALVMLVGFPPVLGITFAVASGIAAAGLIRLVIGIPHPERRRKQQQVS